MMETENGATWFLRCADCHAMYIAVDGLIFDQAANTLKSEPLWARPARQRKPKVCKHDGAIESWTGTAWITATQRKQAIDRIIAEVAT